MSRQFLAYEPQDNSSQYLEDLATGYWFAEALFTAVELKIFSLLEPAGRKTDEISEILQLNPGALRRFLDALCAMGLLSSGDDTYYNTRLASQYLVTGGELYMGDSILWRKQLAVNWKNLSTCLQKGGRVDIGSTDDGELRGRIKKYINAMDCVAKAKVQEMLPYFEGLSLKGRILDIGAGSGAVSAGFLLRFPEITATLVDIPEVLEYAGELMAEGGFGGRVDFCPANVLEPWTIDKGHFKVVILSNIVHAYSEAEISFILEQAAGCLAPDGIMIVHDFYFEHHPAKAALFDINMLINTYNGKVFSQEWLRHELSSHGLHTSEMVPLETDTAVIFAVRDLPVLNSLKLDPVVLLAERIKGLSFKNAVKFSPTHVHVPDWTDLRCRFGCSGYGRPHCPPNSVSPEKTRSMLKDFSKGLLLEGDPPTGDFQRKVLEAEKLAFKAGYHKAFALWAGPCSICSTCGGNGKEQELCRRPKEARPSMEAAGIDVFETVRRAGFEIRTLSQPGEYVKYFALLLLE